MRPREAAPGRLSAARPEAADDELEPREVDGEDGEERLTEPPEPAGGVVLLRDRSAASAIAVAASSRMSAPPAPELALALRCFPFMERLLSPFPRGSPPCPATPAGGRGCNGTGGPPPKGAETGAENSARRGPALPAGAGGRPAAAAAGPRARGREKTPAPDAGGRTPPPSSRPSPGGRRSARGRSGGRGRPPPRARS